MFEFSTHFSSRAPQTLGTQGILCKARAGMMNPPRHPAYGARESTSWWRSNWKWVVPVGCLGMLVALGALVAVILVIVFSAIKSSEPADYAARSARADPRVHAELGQPVDVGFFVSGSVNSSGPSGNADLSLPLSGPKGTGTLYVVARKQSGQWQYSALGLAVDGKPGRINLLTEPAAPAIPAATAIPPAPAPATEPAPAPERGAGGTYTVQ